ncbi:nucleolar and spindle-associated protein 1 [Stegostoma tigrinum]|uniref:nucleolar and spindle-associated protein 1 n=1 Tax=Stegostoma tigrinum TaxID=3053191 RepID=UPI00202B3687|nr:nucleolar and spindle-associated protein 1 [Stegostoma tigrinum]
MELHELRYSELQRLAKQHGLRANLKADKLLKKLQERFQQEQKDDPTLKATVEENTCNTVNVEKWEDSNVTKRRGKEKLPNGNQNESVHLQIFTASEKEQPSMEPSPHLEKSQSIEGSGVKRRQRKRHAEFEDSAEKDEIARNVADDSAPVNQSTHHLSNETATDASKGTTAQSKTGKIPRFIRATGKPGLKSPPAGGKTGLNHMTPDWKKIHQASFNKMESIDRYIERKRKRFETFGNPVKQKSENEPKDMKNMANFSSPERQTSKNNQFLTPANQRQSTRNSATVTLDEKSVFKPSVYSVTKMNVRFTDVAKDIDKPGMKTPTRKFNPGSEVKKIRPSGPEKPVGQKQTCSNTNNPAQTTVVTPYQFSGNTTPGTKKKFDLQASLSRPLRYKPHKGKLKSWEEMKENKMTQSKTLHMSAWSHKKDPKQPKLQTRENRRETFLEERKERKNNVIGARRGLVMMK